jgi:hypothetical protein
MRLLDNVMFTHRVRYKLGVKLVGELTMAEKEEAKRTSLEDLLGPGRG